MHDCRLGDPINFAPPRQNGAPGNFYEGFMASGYATDATDAAIQRNIVAVGYQWSK